MLSHYNSLQTNSIYENHRMISTERGLYFIAGGITFKRLFENVVYRPKSIFFYDTTVLSKPKFTFYPLAILHQILNHSADVYHRAIFG